MKNNKIKDCLIVTFPKYDNSDSDEDEGKEYLGKGFILTHGTKIVETPDGSFLPTTVTWVCDLETGDINAYHPDDLVIGLHDNDLMDVLR